MPQLRSKRADVNAGNSGLVWVNDVPSARLMGLWVKEKEWRDSPNPRFKYSFQPAEPAAAITTRQDSWITTSTLALVTLMKISEGAGM